MQRLRLIARNPRRLVPVIAALALAASAGVNRPNRIAAAHPVPLTPKEGSAIVRADGMTPGQARTGIVTLDVTHPAAPIEILARGTPYGRLRATPLGIFAAGETRTYAFIVSFPSGGVPTGPYDGDNTFRHSTASATIRWRASA